MEAITAALFAVVGAWMPGPVALPLTLLFVAAMIVVTFVDMDHMIIPDVITIPGIAIGLVAAFAGGAIEPRQALFGVLVGGGSLLLVAYAYRAVTGRDGLGGGDVKLLGMVGAFLGPAGAFLTIMIGSFAGTLFAAIFMMRRGVGRKAELPFGTFLAPGAVVVLLFGARMLEAYWGLFTG